MSLYLINLDKINNQSTLLNLWGQIAATDEAKPVKKPVKSISEITKDYDSAHGVKDTAPVKT